MVKVDKALERRRERRQHLFLHFVCIFLYCQTNRNNRSCSLELEISKLMTYVYAAAVCTQTENVGYFVSTDYYYCIFIFTELGIFEKHCAAVTVFTHS